MIGAWMRRYAGGTAVLLALAIPVPVSAGDDGQNPSLLGRLFGRSSGSSSSGGSGSAPASSNGMSSAPSRLPYGGSYYNAAPAGGRSAFGTALPAGGSSTSSSSAPIAGSAANALAPPPSATSNFGGLPETPPVSSGGPSDRLTPRSRVSSAVTNADPVLTRFALGRSNDGAAFGMFMQIFADGTIVDSEGVHHVRPADLRPILEATQSGELYRLRGHCGAPSTDFVEYVHFVAYERRLGRLQAHSFSYSGNPQGCDQIVRHLHNAIENLQTKISRPAQGMPAASSPTPLGAPAGAPSPTAPAIPLTPAVPGH